jgi:hypothetical protein
MVLKKIPAAFLLFAVLLLSSCASGSRASGHLAAGPRPLAVYVQPFANLTTTPDAGRSVTVLLEAELRRHRAFRVVSPASLPFSLPASTSATGMSPVQRERLLAAGVTAFLSGSVIEYAYRSELESEPVVGIAWTMTDLSTGRVLWSASLSGVGGCFLGCHQTLTSLSGRLIAREVARFEGR